MMPGEMKRIAFGEYAPDLAPIANQGLTVARNTVTTATGYNGMQGLSNVSAFSALAERPRGGISVIDARGNPYNFAGTETKIYRHFEVTSDVSRVSGVDYNCGSFNRWEFAIFGDIVIAVNLNDDSQYYTLGVSNTFEPIADVNAPRARHVGVVGAFLMLGNTFDITNGGAENAIHWSAVADPFNWPATGSGTAVAVQSDRQVLEGDGGAVQAVATGSEVGAIFQERCIWRADYRGGDVVFQLTRVEPQRGLLIEGLAVPFGRQVFYCSEDGFYLFDYTSSRPIGREKVNKTFFNDLDSAYLDRVTAVPDPDNERIWVSYPGRGNLNGTPNKLLIYDWGLDRWSHGEQALELLVEATPAAVTLDTEAPGDGTDPDAVDGTDGSGNTLLSFDARLANTGSVQMGAYDSTFRLSTFTGTDLDSVLETGRQEFAPGGRALVTMARPLVDDRDATIEISGVGKTNADDAFGLASKTDIDGDVPLRKDGRYHKFRVNIPGGFKNAIGLDVSFQRSSRR
jgi:hypothetical protein